MRESWNQGVGGGKANTCVSGIRLWCTDYRGTLTLSAVVSVQYFGVRMHILLILIATYNLLQTISVTICISSYSANDNVISCSLGINDLV